ncbi:MAG: GtrA family protein [Bacteroidetes bacterium]|nr:GtrA family protein [Bacteroidota bacterium]
MITFLKVQAASIIGSLTYFLGTFLSVGIFHSPHGVGVLIGNIVGGITQFVLCRNWVFKTTDGKIFQRIVKFILVWIGNLVLSELGVYFFTHYTNFTQDTEMNYKISVVLTSVLLGASYNYLMQKKFVFS